MGPLTRVICSDGVEIKSVFSVAMFSWFSCHFWAGNAIIGRAATEQDIPPLAMNFWRWVMALAFYSLFGKQTLDLWPKIRSNIKFI